jgi:maleylacetoacetate isomerase/maleylpyruvate isomerase
VILHNFPLSSASYRVRIALNLKGLGYEVRNYKLRAGEQRSHDYLAINPAGLVPTLEIDGLRLTQSLAIIDYLDSTHPIPRLIPADPAARARSLAIALTVACDIHPLNNLRVLLYLEKALQQPEAARDAWYAVWVAQGFTALEGMLRERGDTLYADGPEPGIADVCLVPQVYNARRYKVDLTRYPRLVEVADRAAQLKAFADAAPDG